MRYVKAVNDVVVQYPYTRSNLRDDHPGVSFPKTFIASNFAEFNIFEVATVAEPAHNPATHKVVEINPIKVGDNWTQQWQIQALSADELQQNKRRRRPTTAQQRVKNVLNVPAVKAIKTMGDAQTFIDAQVTDLDDAKRYIARLLFMILNLGRASYAEDDDIFPNDE